MTEIFGLIALIGFFCFMTCGICVANSIEARKSVFVANILTALTVVGLIMLVGGAIALLIIKS